MKYLVTALVTFLSLNTYAQNKSKLTVEQIMQGEDFVGYSPKAIQWSPDGQYIYFTWNPNLDTLRSEYKVNIKTKEISKVSYREQRNKPEIGTYNKRHDLLVYSKSGDIFLYDVKTGKKTQITSTVTDENTPKFSGDEKAVVYTSNNNLYAWNIETGSTRQLTDFQKGKKEEEKLPDDQQWLRNEQLRNFEVIYERYREDKLSKEKVDSLRLKRPLKIFVGDKQVSNIRLNPNGKFISYSLRKKAKRKDTEIPEYVTESGYVKHTSGRPKVGSPQDSYDLGIYDITNDTAYYVDTKQIPGIYDKPEFLKDYAKGNFNPKYDKPREVVFHGPLYSEDGKALLEIRSLDHKDRWIMLLDEATNHLKLLDRQDDEAWIGGPGIGNWDESVGNMGWLSDNETVWFQSEATGYSHLYSFNIESMKKKALTAGKFEIRDARLSNDKKYFYIQSNAVSPFVNHFYKMPVNGGKMVQITSREGSNKVTISPDEKFLAIRYSYSNKPWELYFMKNEAGAPMQQLTSSTTKEFEAYDWRIPDIVWFKASDGVNVPARLYQPKSPNGAGIIFVHGAGYLHNVHQWWSEYFREYMFNNLLTDNGYTVLDIDYRGSDGYGRDWRTAIYRWMGGKDLADQEDGANYLVKTQGVDVNRIGIYGGSYGGFMTLMAMFKTPETFRCGAALRSVTDWAHYNHEYTSDILNTPVDDSIAYARSSPIYYANGLKGRLLMLHGMVDNNVEFQDIVRLSQRLIELGKNNWDLAVFPMESHGFVEASSWTNEYRRIYQLFDDTLKK